MPRPEEGVTWFRYVLECSDGSLYVGITTDLRRRLRQHNGELAGGASFTSGRRPVRYLSARPHPRRGPATADERWVRGLSKKRKLAQVAEDLRECGWLWE